MYPFMFYGDKAATAEHAARRHNRDVKTIKQEKKDLNVWEGEGGKPAPIASSS